MWLIILSSLVSLVTIFILCFRLQNTKKIKIPSWFLGKNSKIFSLNKIILKRPPFLPVIFVTLATIAMAGLFYPKALDSKNKSSNKSNIIWLDNSLSAKIARIENDFSYSEVAEKIFTLSSNHFGLDSKYLIINSKIKAQYNLIPLNSINEIQEFIENQDKYPATPFLSSIDSKEIINIIENNKKLSQKNNRIIAISDGQIEKINAFYPLRHHFKSGFLIQDTAAKKGINQSQELIPKNLAQTWNVPTTNSDFEIFDIEKFKIPEEARPHIFLNKLQVKNEIFSFITEKRNYAKLPLFIVCSERFPGALELDTFASLRNLVQFFKSELIEKNCFVPQSTEVKSKDFWQYRDPALWVVPINNIVSYKLNIELKFWTPDGFNPSYDSLVYVAAPYDLIDVIKTPIQLESGSFPIPVYLIQPPPRIEIGLKMPEENLEYKGMFKVHQSTSDGTPLIYKASSLPFFYLRTTTSTPNGELARSKTWAKIWIEMANNVKRSNMSIASLNLQDIEKIENAFEEAGLREDLSFSQKLNLNNLHFEKPTFFTSGIYKSENQNKLILVNEPYSTEDLTYISVSEFKNMFGAESIESSSTKSRLNENHIFNYLFSTIAIVCLLFLWKKSSLKSGALIILVHSIFIHENQVFSQNKLQLPFFLTDRMKQNINIETSNIPFRIAWCESQIPTQVKENYQNLKSILAKRGTISLPKMLTADGCKVGQSEIWWSNSIKNLLQDNLLQHVTSGGVFILEGTQSFPEILNELNDYGIGLEWESPAKRGMFYRSFYLLSQLDGCVPDKTKVLILKKKINAQSPFGIVSSAFFLSHGQDCFKDNIDNKIRSFINMMYSILTTDYKEDQLQLPEILNRIRNLGLEP